MSDDCREFGVDVTHQHKVPKGWMVRRGMYHGDDSFMVWDGQNHVMHPTKKFKMRMAIEQLDAYARYKQSDLAARDKSLVETIIKARDAMDAAPVPMHDGKIEPAP
jgi:hypothetical protein